MSSATAPSPAGLAGRDLTARGAVTMACATLGVVTVLDLLDGRLGIVFSIGFVLAAVTAPVSVESRGLLPTGVLPPVLLVGALMLVAVVNSDALVVDGLSPDVGAFGRLVASVVDHGIVLVVGHGLALAAIVARIVTAER
ncbi:DUF6542 domain-containing protein [Aeromicrobium terrae]|uniref:DUF6542 domain-containing protein n=1 Tax=Aeromicrobium terrae TaxID=2498846 RepID=A0A5C8NL15_9ACTN|nr:DUF6542 domain-containing protein [Aeromicrobium terrae]TXL61491.1 hypothetical protein FHP06_08690 [Aeromicrobium terrae]